MEGLTSWAHSVYILLFFSLFLHAQSQQLQSNEQTVLLRLKQYWNNPPLLDQWTASSSPGSHCSWLGVNCTGGSVTELVLSNMNINDTAPSFLCDLGNLTKLDLSYNNIPGGFPKALYNCSKLQYLDISQNYFVGPIPSDIDRMSNLQYFSVAANNFSFDIPPAIGRLSQLRSLYLYQCQFNGTYPAEEIANLSNLMELALAYNTKLIPSAFPVSFTTKLKKLTSLWMTDMNLMGQIPESIGNLESLHFLDLSRNPLTGKIPSSIFTLKNLSSIYIFGANLSGEIPQKIESLELEVIDLSANKLTGSIPEGFGELKKLKSLILMFNQLSGTIPESLGRLPALTDVRLFSNNLSGVLPPDFGLFSPLEGFEVNKNQLTGTLPENLCFNGKLLGVVASDNNLTGKLPESLGNCSGLLIVSVSNNRLSGKVPGGLWTLFNMSIVQLENNGFSGDLPDRISPNLSRIEIRSNQFSGNIPESIGSWKNLKVLDASNNLLSGSIPGEITDLPLLETLLLDQNNLSGSLPEVINSWDHLSMLNLSNNRLSGQIPGSISLLPVLTQLDLSKNQLSGNIPSQLGTLKLTVLNLSSNQLTGRIPDELNNLAYSSSFLDNPGLCASNPEILLKACSSQSRSSSKSSKNLLFIILAAVFASLTVVVVCAYALKIYRDSRRDIGYTWKLTPFLKLDFTESDILTGLMEHNVVGSGGSGKVYKVPIDHWQGRCVAVKRIFNSRKLDHKLEKEFLAEVRILGKIRHANIVKLLCCMSSESSKLLVYEYMENRSLDQWLNRKKRPLLLSGGSGDVPLNWPTRLKIAVGAAQGLCYMHHDCVPPIIHRDVKSSNILLDSEFNAKIADFGLARMLIKPGDIDTVSAVAGTFGYIAPESAHTRRVTAKIDVFSFGVILLELATGREANDGDEEMSLSEWAWHHLQEDRPIADALDDEIREAGYLHEMISVFKLGIICTAINPLTRPSMKDVLYVLKQWSDSYGSPLQKKAVDEYAAAPHPRISKRAQPQNDYHSKLSPDTF